MKLVIVESPSKAKTINKYLGSQYKVIASFGHVRDLPSKNGSVLPDKNFELKYEISDKSKKYVSEIVKLAKQSEQVLLATDPDREGESISWHVAEILKQKKIFKNNDHFQRVAFNEITKKAVLDAVAHPRKIDDNLVNAQQARRALDYLVGFTLSPVLWRKLPGCRSAGRVQSVALRMICEREQEIESFVSREFWNISLDMFGNNKEVFKANLTHVDNKKLDKFSIALENDAKELEKRIKKQNFSVLSIQKKQQKRLPPPPFITSSLQQEAARKLGFSAKKTMQIAQKLYEGFDIDGETVGLITYMRTDGVTLSQEAVNSVRDVVKDKYGAKYLPSSPRIFKSKSKNAQEAHEAIRPTNPSLAPSGLSKILDKDQKNLYDLIWKRTLACQMENVVLDLVGVDIISDDKQFQARATGSTITFDGFYKIYQEGKDDSEEEENNILPILSESEKLTIKEIYPTQHFTQPPPRFSEASLVKKLEELGIGRPSTYASIISVLQERNYVRVEKKRFYPNDLGRLVTAFLVGFFKRYVEYDFTASLEEDLDKIAEGNLNWKNLLDQFWQGFITNIDKVGEKDIAEVIKYVEESLDFYLFGKKDTPEYEKNKKCSTCSDGILNLKLGKYGAFLACSNYPDCSFKKSVGSPDETSKTQESSYTNDENKELGKDEKGALISLKKGPYGWYVQMDEPDDKSKKKIKPKRSSLPSAIKPQDVNLELAIKLLNLPALIGKHSDTGEDILMGIGKYGPYVKYKNKFFSIPKNIDPFSVDRDYAEEIIAQKNSK